MANLLVDERDVKFVLFEQLRIDELAQTEKYGDYSRDMCLMVLEAAQKLAENELWPANADGDRVGVRLENGRVRVPQSFHKVYALYRDGAWPSLSVSPEHGGQGAPITLYAAAMENFVAANLAFMAYPGLALGAARLIEVFGAEEQRRTYMDKMYTGEWGGAMCLTEPHAGSDVGALRTKAVKNPDGSYSIVGNKIFITSGDHDLVDNIVHMVLARVEGAPAGTKGTSIFIVPKKRVENGALVDNDVITAAVERKLGIHGSATCALNFGEKGNCKGFLVGEENQGMKIMFHLINDARLAVGVQGLALASGAYMHALRYANERAQGPDFRQMRDPAAAKIPIIDHPDVRRMLLWMKSVTEGMRCLLYFAASCEDRTRIAQTKEAAAKYQGLLDLLIPVCKAWCSDMGFRVAELAVQTHGGYGFCSEYPVEQFLRDIKITSIYEGTNAIQALDLVGRKLPLNQGALFRSFLEEMDGHLAGVKDNSRLKETARKVDEARSKLIEATVYFAQKGMSGDPLTPVLNATTYLGLFGDVVVGSMLLWQAAIADEKLEQIYKEAGAETDDQKKEVFLSSRDAAFYRGKLASARFFADSILSLAGGKAQSMMTGDLSPVEIPKQSFGLF